MATVSELVTAAELADSLRVSTRTVLRWAKRGVIESIRIGPKCVRFDLPRVAAAIGIHLEASP